VLEYNYSSRIIAPSSVTYAGAGTLRTAGTGSVVFGPGIINVDFSPGALIDVQSGLLTGSSSYGGIWASNQASINIDSGAVFDAVEASPNGAMQIDALTGAGTFQGGFYLNNNAGLSTVTIGVADGSGTFDGSLQNDLDARLGIVKTGTGTETLSGTNTYSGGTVVDGGTLALNGTAGSGSVIVVGGTLAGTGTIAGPVAVDSGGTFYPGAPLGTISISNTLFLAGNTVMAINSGTNSQVVGLSHITYGGLLTITNLGATLAAGNTFPLFSAASYSGSFDAIVANFGDGVTFGFNPTNGTLTILNVVYHPPTVPTNLTCTAISGAITVSWPAIYTGWILQAQKNPASQEGLTTNWADVSGSDTVNSLTFSTTALNSGFFRLRAPSEPSQPLSPPAK
jgi:autotransporter-associated beta strand protein